MWMFAHALAILQSLILISAANGVPVLVARLLGARFAHPIDGGIEALIVFWTSSSRIRRAPPSSRKRGLGLAQDYLKRGWSVVGTVRGMARLITSRIAPAGG